jgi:hypothetical protein
MFSILGVVSDLTGFGAAGLMGSMWLWERRASRLREEQLTDSHARILRDEQRLSSLTDALERNTAAFARFAEAQQHLDRTLSHLTEELHHARRTA